MEKFTKNHLVMFAFIAMGLLFSGYLSGVKLFTDTCAFGASCPIFLGYPACYTGFIVYAIIAIIGIISLFKKELSRAMLVTITGVSFFGVLFSGKLTLVEMSVLFDEGLIPFVKSLPLCSIGLIVYIVIFVLSLVIGKECTDPCCGHCNIEKVKEEPKQGTVAAAPSDFSAPPKEEIPVIETVTEVEVPTLETHVAAATEAVPEITEEVKLEDKTDIV